MLYKDKWIKSLYSVSKTDTTYIKQGYPDTCPLWGELIFSLTAKPFLTAPINLTDFCYY